MAFVVDNAVVCGWLLASQASAYRDAITGRVQTGLPRSTAQQALANAATAAGVGVVSVSIR
jgi:hypothetical protein